MRQESPAVLDESHDEDLHSASTLLSRSSRARSYL